MSCVKDRDFEILDTNCLDTQIETIEISDLKSLYAGETVQIHEDLAIYGYVVSSDKKGNFFNVIHFSR